MADILTSYLASFARDVIAIDQQLELPEKHLTTFDLLYWGNALSGESGEASNTIKKIVRDGETPQLWAKLAEELADCMIYFCEVVRRADIDIDEAWVQKHQVLAERIKLGILKHGPLTVRMLFKPLPSGPKKIIVEGADKTGKSTLVEGLSRIFGLPIYDSDRIDDPDELLHYINVELEGNALNGYILDRWNYPSDLMYRKIVAQGTSVLEPLRRRIEETLVAQNAMILHITCDMHTIEQRYKQTGGDDYLHLSKVPMILAEYRRFFHTTIIPYCTIDTSCLLPHEVLECAASAVSSFYTKED